MKIRYIEINNFRGIKKFSCYIPGDFVCLIGACDSCKSTILDAIDYTLLPHWNLNINDSDFFNQDTTKPIELKMTLSEWDANDENVKQFFNEKNFGQYQCGLTEEGRPVSEPNEKTAITIMLQIDASLEPKWTVINTEEKIITAAQRNLFGVSRIGMHLDHHFSWQYNSLLTRLSSTNKENITPVLAAIARAARKTPVKSEKYEPVLKTLSEATGKIGVRLEELTPKIDIQKSSFSSGALTLHHGNVPIEIWVTDRRN